MFSTEMAQFRASKREYEVWPGKNRFCFGGHLMTGPWSDCGPNTCVWSIILLPLSAFFWFIGPKLWQRVPILLFVVLIFGLWTIIALVITGFSDPGIIPRQTRADAWRQVLQARGGNQRLEDIDQHATLPMSISLMLDGEMAKHTYCSTCHIYKPPRTSHCSDCDNCCKEFDHHCPFVGNCVGERNYGAFCAFLICVVALIVSVLTSVLMVSSAVRGETTVNMIFIIIICGYSALMFFVIGGFSAFHCFLVITGQTTKQKLKGLAGDEAKGRTVACINRPPSLIDPRRFLSPAQVEMSTTSSLDDENSLESVRLVNE